MTVGRRSYIVRDAGTESRPGKVYKIYPYTLQALNEALDEARLRSYKGPPQIVTVIRDRESKIIRRYERGHEVPVPPLGRGSLSGKRPAGILSVPVIH